jgi:4a-hydroxytetrahydrobiopterin dehydratase
MKLDPTRLTSHLKRIPLWTPAGERGGVLSRKFVFDDFAQAFSFMAQVAIAAEKRNHHPEWFNVYNRVEVVLTTHDAEGISMNDIEMAVFMDSIASALANQAR